MAEGQPANDVATVVVVVGQQFIVPNDVNLTLKSTGGLFSPKNLYKVRNTNGDVVFKVNGFCFSSRRLLLDANGSPLVTMKPKDCSCRGTWRVFRGESTDLLFTLRKSKIFQCKDNFDVFLATNDQAAPCDFKIKTRNETCTIYIAESDRFIAQIHRRTPCCARDRLEITVKPNKDIAFIVSLIAILEEINKAIGLSDVIMEVVGSGAGAFS